MGNGLSVAFACPFEPIEASFAVSDSAGSRTLRLHNSHVLIFAVRGGICVHTKLNQVDLGAEEALLLHVQGLEKVTLGICDNAEFYSVRFRFFPAASAGASLDVPEHVRVRRPERLTDLLRRYIAEEKRDHASRLMLYHLLALALCELSCSTEEARAIPDEPGFEIVASRVDAYIAAHYSEAIGTPEIARELRYNPEYLERAYRQERGISIREAIHRRRIKEARAQLLLQGERRVADIAAMCGFSDTGYFRRVFKRVTNMTPNGFRTINSFQNRGKEAVGRR